MSPVPSTSMTGNARPACYLRDRFKVTIEPEEQTQVDNPHLATNTRPETHQAAASRSPWRRPGSRRAYVEGCRRRHDEAAALCDLRDLDRHFAHRADNLGLCCRPARLAHAEAIGHFIHAKVHFPWVWIGILGKIGDACPTTHGTHQVPSVPVARRSQCDWFISAPDALNFAVRMKSRTASTCRQHTEAYNDCITIRLQVCQLASGLILKALAPVLRNFYSAEHDLLAIATALQRSAIGIQVDN